MELSTIFELKDNGPDKCNLHENRIVKLIHSNILPDSRLDWIVQYRETSERPVQKKYFREKLTREVENSSVSECFEEIKLCGDIYIQEYIILRSVLKAEHVKWLTKNGSNRKLRNIAKELLNSSRFKDSVAFIAHKIIQLYEPGA
ncbi:hypothetical protein ACG1BZ_04795 [Microbulbifer sp. CNSA002]|uniref:hypothetical protein n=1 Tax=unclassified Microbulbifer TaxID=2619833 RepID=UPI0039B5D291